MIADIQNLRRAIIHSRELTSLDRTSFPPVGRAANSIYQRQDERIFFVSGDAAMQIAEWRKTIGEMVREHMRSAGAGALFFGKDEQSRGRS